MPRYPLIHRLLHWVIAAIVLWQAAVGITFMILEFEGTLRTFGKETTDLLYTYHKSFGIVLLGLMLLRLGIRLSAGRLPYSPPIAGWEHGVSGAVHGALYAGLILQPLLGWAATAAGGFPVQFFGSTLPGIVPRNEPLGAILFGVHGAVGSLIVLLMLLHIAGALRHWWRSDGVMRRMSLS